jgi:hypothetical protein
MRAGASRPAPAPARDDEPWERSLPFRRVVTGQLLAVLAAALLAAGVTYWSGSPARSRPAAPVTAARRSPAGVTRRVDERPTRQQAREVPAALSPGGPARRPAL